MSTHTLPADTRMEDMLSWDPPLASGDTINLNSHVLTCETDLSSITALYATGTGTIRLLAGGNADFSGSNPLPSTVTIEGGTEATPLPAHGEYGYYMRSSACIKLRDNTTFSGKIVSHCAGNKDRPQWAKVNGISGSTLFFDRDMELEAGDWLSWHTTTNIQKTYIVQSYSSGSMAATVSTSEFLPSIGNPVALATSGLCVYITNSAASLVLAGQISGDELGVVSGVPSTQIGYVVGGHIDIGRLVIYALRYKNELGAVGNAVGRIGLVYACANAFSSHSNRRFGGYLEVGSIIASGGALSNVLSGNSLRVKGGVVSGLTGKVSVNGRAEYVDTLLPSPLYSGLSQADELIVRTTTGDRPTCTVHRAGGLATLAQRSDFTVPTALPDAWLLTPLDDGTAWHDEAAVVAPGKTLNVIWHCFLGEEGARAGMQVLDGEWPGFGAMAVQMGMAETLAETKTAEDAPTFVWLPPVRVMWRNESTRARKVVLRGWATGGTCYSRINPSAGGLA